MNRRTSRAFVEELYAIKVAEPMSGNATLVSDEKPSPPPSPFRRFAESALVGAAGYGVGYGLGSATGRMLAEAAPSIHRHRAFPHALGAGTALAAFLANQMRDRQKEYERGSQQTTPLHAPR